ncbi:MAG: 4-alpha-glucanotransferase [Oscillospiraceae bacterium]|nr:4-alpha-glucanotransferase [Oscillospiraceae bacterium]
MKRASGVLLHISSLPGQHSIGSLGKSARRFVDFLKSAGFTYWQILPINETDDCNSPYKSPSAFAGNPLFISLEELHLQGLLNKSELDEHQQKTPYSCEFDILRKTRLPLLRKAFSRIGQDIKLKAESFANQNKQIAEYADFMALKAANGGKRWQDWETTEADKNEVGFYRFLQYEFFRQWNDLKIYANKNNVKIIGDMPIYVSEDSADVYYNRKIFLLDPQGDPLAGAGVPPDYFSETGQNWGNPLYDWDELKKTGYKWWIERIEHSLRLFDKVRIDHFRGFSEFWSIPKDREPIDGKWEKGPGMDFFNELKKVIPKPEIIAEDLGDIDIKTVELLKKTKFPGMKVMQFGFMDGSDSVHLPHNYIENTVAYIGTHDNNTLLGWLWELVPEAREWVLDYCGYTNGDWSSGGAGAGAIRSVIRALYLSAAGVVILTIQDLCGYGRDTRINIPGKSENNWAFRITEEQLGTIDKSWIIKMNKTYKRNIL